MFYLSCIIMICAIIIVLVFRYNTLKIFEHLNNMIDSIIEGSFKETVFDESKLSALESKFAHYLLASQISSKNIKEDRKKIKELLTDISHQTKTPIANILLYSEMLMENSSCEEERQNLEVLHQQAKKLMFLTASLVKLSRLETGIITVNAALNSLKTLAVEVLRQYEPLAQQKGLYLTFLQLEDDSSDDSYFAKYDKKWTMEAVGNIIDNAIKYTSKGGITISLKSFELFCCIEIADTGIGISDGEIPFIFKRFYRSQSVSQIQGTGVGLYLAREIISSENGYIKTASNLNKGTTFFIYLPR